MLCVIYVDFWKEWLGILVMVGSVSSLAPSTCGVFCLSVPGGGVGVCGVSVSRDIQNLPGHVPGGSGTGDPAVWQGGWTG